MLCLNVCIQSDDKKYMTGYTTKQGVSQKISLVSYKGTERRETIMLMDVVTKKMRCLMRPLSLTFLDMEKVHINVYVKFKFSKIIHIDYRDRIFCTNPIKVNMGN